MSDLSEELRRLEYYQRREAKRTFIARAVLLTFIVGLLGTNLMMTWQMRSDMVVNIDQARLEQAALQDQQNVDLVAMEQRLAAVEDCQAEALEPVEVVASR
jgi:hypothetical protein